QPVEPAMGHQARETEPLPTPPTQSTPFTAKLQRNTTDLLPRTNDLSDRRGPITAVFGPEDMQDEPPVTAPQDSGTTGTGRATARTEPLGQRQTEPLSPAKTTSVSKNDSRTPSGGKGGSSQTNLVILFGLLGLTALGLVAGATSYLKQKAQA